MESQPANRTNASETVARRGLKLLSNAKFEIILFVLLLLTVAAVAWQDRILVRSTVLTPQSIASYPSLIHTDNNPEIKGKSGGTLIAPMRWTCDLRAGFDYPYCGYEVFFNQPGTTKGLDLTNFRSLSIRFTYRGPGKSVRVHLKNFDPRYSKTVEDDTSKFNRVEADVTPGRVQQLDFSLADFGVADWWLFKHKVAPKFSHPQFDNVTSVDIQTGTEIALGHHEFEVQEIVLRTAIMSVAQYYLSLLGIWVVLIGIYLAYRLRNLRGELERRQTLQALTLRQAQEAEEEARRDHLTKLLNRRGVAERFETLPEDAPPAGLAVILIDIDHFKSLNDRFGHSYGDEVLSTIATLIKRNVRGGDFVGRWGGEEFLAVCPGIDALEAQHVAEKIRRRIEHFHFGDCEQVTTSVGVHWTPATGPELTELVGLADVALYSAKRGGRNACCLYRPGMAKAA
ncbi:diguanylate cyclase [Sphingomonas sp. LB-2]|uniref:GGDEF domain-containing protein n=1 Tax=Sphingomonas caeni TaxID=2984949 RepID=UPI0022325265|nr:diguanylate cyclase [Sphingomonas caeni]MCW3846120.1 diguanylate cyclase [Sphingomonas caeni]